jgi:uncharacterized protein YjcR
MPRARDPNRDKAYEIWKESKGKKLLKDIAVELGVSDSQIRKWKSQDKWEQKNGNVTNSKRSVTKRSTKGGQPGNSNAKGNKGNPNASAPKQNSNALRHGFFSKYLPQESLDIMEELQERSPADMIWDQIQIQYAAIIRAQKIMFVSDKSEMIKELKKAKYEYHQRSEEEGGGIEKNVTEEEYEFQFAWDRHATFLNAQSRAMSELRSLIKQFNELAHEDDERRLKLEQMKLGIEKTKAEIDKITDDDNDKPIEVVIKRKGDR